MLRKFDRERVEIANDPVRRKKVTRSYALGRLLFMTLFVVSLFVRNATGFQDSDLFVTIFLVLGLYSDIMVRILTLREHDQSEGAQLESRA